MKTTSKVLLTALVTFMMIPEADGVMGVRRRTARRTTVVVGTSVHAADAAAMSQSQQQAAAAQQQAAASQQQAAASQQQAAASQQQPAATPQQPATAASGEKLPLGTVVSTLPPGAVSTPVGGVEYYYSNGNFYRAVFQGNALVYVTAEPN